MEGVMAATAEYSQISVVPSSLGSDDGDSSSTAEPASSGSHSPEASNAQDRLGYWKETVRQNVRSSYYSVGQALYSVLHDERLLKATNFVKWANLNFGLTRSTAYEYIRAYRIVEMIHEQDPTLQVPSTLSHFRVFNKISLKDGGLKAYQLWREILNMTPPEHQERLTAKEVLAKGREIILEQGLSKDGTSNSGPSSTTGVAVAAEKTYDMHDEYHGQLPKAEVGKRRRPVREHARRATGYLRSMQDDLTLDTMGDSDYGTSYLSEEEMDNCERKVATFSQQTGRRSSREPKSKRAFAAAVADSTPSPDAPPALIRIASGGSKRKCQPTLTPTLLAELARQLVPNGFDISVCPLATVEEERAVGARYILGDDGHRQQWSGMVWGNFCGPRFHDHYELAPYIEAAMDKFNSGEFDCGVFVVNLAFGSRFFPSLLEYPHCFLFKPIATLVPAAEGQDEADEMYHYNVVVTYFGSDASQFVNLFSEYGSIPGVNSWCNY